MLKLFIAPNTCALASHIALEEAAARYKTVRIDFSANEQRKPEYLAINPKGRVPALATEHGVLTETPAILAFIAQSFPQARLAPLADPFEFARVQAFNSYLCAACWRLPEIPDTGDCSCCGRQGQRGEGGFREDRFPDGRERSGGQADASDQSARQSVAVSERHGAEQIA